jgi:citronellol/citronellal dehydrogenase
MSPPLDMQPKWFAASLPYTISKYNMSMLALGWAAELKKDGIAANSLWPATTIATAAVKNLLGGELMVAHSRKPEIVADAAFHILSQPAATCTGNHFIDEDVLKQAGITDFEPYAITPGVALQKDLFLD